MKLVYYAPNQRPEPNRAATVERSCEPDQAKGTAGEKRRYQVELVSIKAGDLWPPLYESNGHTLQRKESDARVKALHDEWDDELVGVLYVSVLTDGPNAGQYAIDDGLSRVRSKMDGSVEGITPDPEYVFHCVVAERKVIEVARRFIGFNKDRKAVSKLDEYKVGLSAEADWALSIKEALDQHNLVADRFPRYPNGSHGTMAAIASCEQTVRKAAGRPPNEDWGLGAAHLAFVLKATLASFRPGGMVDRDEIYALNGDLIKAVSSLVHRNAEKFYGPRSSMFYTRLVETLQAHSSTDWISTSTLLSTSRGAIPGSGGRPAYLEALIADRFNRRLRDPERRLTMTARMEALLDRSVR